MEPGPGVPRRPTAFGQPANRVYPNCNPVSGRLALLLAGWLEAPSEAVIATDATSPRMSYMPARRLGAGVGIAAVLAVAGASGCASRADAPVAPLTRTTGQSSGQSSDQPTSATPTDPTPSPAPSTSPSADTPAAPPFAGTVRPIGSALRARMQFSHRPGCPVDQADLRYLRLSFVKFDGSVGTGEMIVHESYADAVVQVFRRLYTSGWPIRRMRLVDDYRGDDALSLAANNTSGYNCRTVAGGDGWSEHAYGRAIDINPVQNPYVQGSSVAPPAGRRYTSIDRSPGAAVPRGVIRSDDVVVSAFARIGWEWGGEWINSKDYQHFSATGR